MKFIVSRNHLLQAMRHSCFKMPKGTPLLYANHYKMRIENKTLFVTGVNPTGESSPTFVTEKIVLEKEPAGSLVDGRPFFVYNGILRAIKSLEEQPLELTVEEYQLTVRHEYGYFRVPLSNIGFPAAKPMEAEGITHIKMENPGLYSCLSKVAFAAADDELRPALSGVFVEVEKEYINFVASDGHILMCLTKTCSEPNENCCSFIIPRFVAGVILKILPKTGYCELSYNNNLASLLIDDNLCIDFACTESRYPNFRMVIPTEGFFTTFSVDKRTFLKSVNRLHLFSGYSTQSVKLSLNSQKPNLLILNTKCLDEDTIGQEKIACDITDGAHKFGKGLLFRIPLLTRILNHIPAEKVTFMSTGSDTGCLMSFEPMPDVENLTALIMPMMQSDDD